MGKNTVFANGRSVACKSGNGKMICAFPNVCFTPPQAPPAPLGVPLPYPNTGYASKTTAGTKRIRIGGKEVMLRDRSFFKKSTGSEAGRAPRKGILTGKNDGKTYFAGWSFNVVFEGKNAVRHLDVTTYNHGSKPGNGGVWVFKERAGMAEAAASSCRSELNRAKRACGRVDRIKCPDVGKSSWNRSAQFQSNECQRAARCLLVPFNRGKNRCCRPQTAHHLVPKAVFYGESGTNLPLSPAYDPNTAPCICVEGGSYTVATHGLFHLAYAKGVRKLPPDKCTFKKACEVAASNVREVFRGSGCSTRCIKAQLLLGGHEGVDGNTLLASTRSKTRCAVSDRLLKRLYKLQATINGA